MNIQNSREDKCSSSDFSFKIVRFEYNNPIERPKKKKHVDNQLSCHSKICECVNR